MFANIRYTTSVFFVPMVENAISESDERLDFENMDDEKFPLVSTAGVDSISMIGLVSSGWIKPLNEDCYQLTRVGYETYASYIEIFEGID